MSQRIGITILGSTGTIGVNTLDVIALHLDHYKIIALTAHSNYQRLYQQCITYQPQYAVIVDKEKAKLLKNLLHQVKSNTEVLSGTTALSTVSTLDEVDHVMAGIVGAAGLIPNLAAARYGKRVLLANKESLVMSGQLFIDTIRNNNAELLPIDSEHNAIFQCLTNQSDKALNRILLTGSGGPFLERDLATFDAITPEEAVAHPNWMMGRKISVDSATMMNKGLELIEACWLFDTDVDQIDVVIHPQSIIHSMVSYKDGSVIAQMGMPDMRTPIAYSLAWPERMEAGVEALDFYTLADLSFKRPDFERFPCLALAYAAHREGGYATIALNAANEIAVDAFLNKKIKFTDIPRLIENVLSKASSGTSIELDAILEQDEQSRLYAKEWMASCCT